MAYNNSNHIERRKRAVRVTLEHFEPGRHDRSYKWVWRKFIRDEFNIAYDTYLRWLRAEGLGRYDRPSID